MPLSPAAMGLLALLVASVGYVALRQRSGLMALVLAVVVGAAGLAADVRQALAAALYTVVLSGGSNPATVTVPDGYVGPVDVQNTLGIPVVVTSLAVKATLSIDPTSLLQVGSSIVPGGTVATGLNLVDADPAPVAPPGSAFAGLVNATANDHAGGLPIDSIPAAGVTDPKGRAITYSATGLPVGLAIGPGTGVISGIYDANGTEVFTVTVTAKAAGSAKFISKSFVLTIIDNG